MLAGRGGIYSHFRDESSDLAVKGGEVVCAFGGIDLEVATVQDLRADCIAWSGGRDEWEVNTAEIASTKA